MAGIIASSVSKVMTSADAASVNTEDGYLTAEAITLSATPTGTTYSWAVGKPSGSTVRASLSDSAAAAPTFIPDVAGDYVFSCSVDSATSYVLVASVTQAAISTALEAVRFPPKLASSIVSPPLGVALFHDKTLDSLRVKYPDGSYVTIGGSGIPSWEYYNVTYATLSTAATSGSATLFTAAAGTVIHAVAIKHSASFAGGSITSYTLSLGIAGNLAKFAGAFNVFQATGDIGQFSIGGFCESFTSTTAIKVAAVASHNLSTATTGAAKIGVLKSAVAMT